MLKYCLAVEDNTVSLADRLRANMSDSWSRGTHWCHRAHAGCESPSCLLRSSFVWGFLFLEHTFQGWLVFSWFFSLSFYGPCFCLSFTGHRSLPGIADFLKIMFNPQCFPLISYSRFVYLISIFTNPTQFSLTLFLSLAFSPSFSLSSSAPVSSSLFIHFSHR